MVHKIEEVLICIISCRVLQDMFTDVFCLNCELWIKMKRNIFCF
jgi:hypothetical protein